MAREVSAYAQIVAACEAGKPEARAGDKAKLDFHRAFGGPQCDFLADFTKALRATVLAEDGDATASDRHAAIRFLGGIEAVNGYVTDKLRGMLDSSLESRWGGMVAAMRYVLTGDRAQLQNAAEAFSEAFGRLGIPNAADYEPLETWKDLDPLLNKFVAGPADNRDGHASVFEDRSWKPSTFLLHDWLFNLVSASRLPCRREATPILSVYAGANGDEGSVQRLVVEQIRDRAGPIVPDFFAFGLVAFPRGDFLQAMHKAFKPATRRGRLRWTIEPADHHYPQSFEGASAEVAAACTALALTDDNRPDDGPMLDERTAVTACLGPRREELTDWRLAPIPPRTELGEVEDVTLPLKLEAAAARRLVAVLVVPDQLPQVPEHTVTLRDGTKHTVLIQPVATLAEAYDSLQATSHAVALYKAKVCDRWDKEWENADTPRKYRQASKR
jgi:hypothetical protein